MSEAYYAKYQHMSEKNIKKRILLAQLHALEQEAFMKREIGNMYAQKNKMLDTYNCSNCLTNYCESHARTFTGQDVMTNMPQSPVRPPTHNQSRQISPQRAPQVSPKRALQMSPQVSPQRSLQVSPHLSPVRSSPYRQPRSPPIELQTSNETSGDQVKVVSSPKLSGHISASENEVEKPSKYIYKQLYQFTSFLTILLSRTCK